MQQPSAVECVICAYSMICDEGGTVICLLLTRALGVLRIVFKVGLAPAFNLVSAGYGFQFKADRGSAVHFGFRVFFGAHGGISLISRGGGSAPILRIGDRTSFQQRLSLNCAHHISIGRDCVFSWDVHILDYDFHQIVYEDGIRPPISSPIIIGDRIWVGARVTILKGVVIGDGSVIAAGSVVTRSFPPRSLIAGNPARLVKTIDGWER